MGLGELVVGLGQPGHPEGRALGGTISVAAGGGGVEGRGASTQSEKPKLEGTRSHEVSGKQMKPLLPLMCPPEVSPHLK